jgi:hypothetical protein
MSQVLRTEATDEKEGFMKAIVGAGDDRILGFTMTGSEPGLRHRHTNGIGGGGWLKAGHANCS